ncbi:hypothetical protein D1G14_12775 [Staphylococcus aureus]|nr:hypothetical protein D1G14_12775 [Staphylococcus aureus]
MTEIKCTCNKHFSILVRGPNIEKLEHQFLQTMQVGEGPQHREFQKRNSTGNASWGRLRNNFLYHTMSHSLSKILK